MALIGLTHSQKERLTTMSEIQSQETYVEIEGRDGTKIRGFDFYVTQWSSVLAIVEEVLDSVPPGEHAELKFTILQPMTETEFAEYCEMHEIDCG